MTSQKLMNSHVTLHYFNVRGRAEHIRYLFAAGGRVYDDRRYKWEEWQKFKPKTPFGSMPVLEIDGMLLGSSVTCGRTVAKMVGLYGSGPIEQGDVDSIADTCNDLREAGFAMPGRDKPGHQEAVEEFKLKNLPVTLEKLSNLLGQKQYFVGTERGKLTWADIHFFAVMECMSLYIPLDQLFVGFLSLEALYNRVKENPGIAAYIKKRPKTNL